MNQSLSLRLDGDEGLLQKTEDFKEITREDRQLAVDMLKLMKENGGVGLSANQVGVNKSLLVASYGKYTFVMFNPVLLKAAGGYVKDIEGCLSFPNVVDEVVRAESVQIKYMNSKGEIMIRWFSGAIGRILQHELSHLAGRRWLDETVTEIKKKKELQQKNSET